MKHRRPRPSALLLLLASCIGKPPAPAAPGEGLPKSTSLEIFLLLGQSNREGVPAPSAEDRAEHPRVFVLGYDTCNGRTFNQWSPASAPLHRCGTGVGPGDSFGRAMAEAWPGANIGLVPAAISGVDIDFFRKGVVSERRKEFRIPPTTGDRARTRW